VNESPILPWLTGATVKQAIAKAASRLAEGKPEEVIGQDISLVDESALLHSEAKRCIHWVAVGASSTRRHGVRPHRKWPATLVPPR
jgi:hypothetical protein